MFFEGKYKGAGQGKPNPKSDLKQGIFCAVCALFCFVNIRQMFVYALLFAACAVFRFYHYAKLKKREEMMEDLLDELGDDAEDEDRNVSARAKLPRKERKERYNEFLNDLEKELGDFDTELGDDEQDGNNGKL